MDAAYHGTYVSKAASSALVWRTTEHTQRWAADGLPAWRAGAKRGSNKDLYCGGRARTHRA